MRLNYPNDLTALRDTLLPGEVSVNAKSCPA